MVTWCPERNVSYQLSDELTLSEGQRRASAAQRDCLISDVVKAKPFPVSLWPGWDALQDSHVPQSPCLPIRMRWLWLLAVSGRIEKDF